MKAVCVKGGGSSEVVGSIRCAAMVGCQGRCKPCSRLYVSRMRASKQLWSAHGQPGTALAPAHSLHSLGWKLRSMTLTSMPCDPAPGNSLMATNGMDVWPMYTCHASTTAPGSRLSLFRL